MKHTRRRLLAGLGTLSLLGCSRTGSEHTPPSLTRTEDLRIPAVLHGTLARGPEVRLIEDHGVPLVAMAVALRAGHRDDPQGQEGLARLTSNLLLLGVDGCDQAALLDRYGELGAMPDAFVAPALLGLQCVVHVDQGAAALRLMVENLRYATLGDEPFERLRRAQREALIASRGDPSHVAGLGVLLASGGHEPPTGMLSSGTPRSVDAVRPEDARRWWSVRLRPASLVVLIAGAVHPEDASSWVDLATRGWSSPADPVPSLPVRDVVGPRDRMTSVLVPWPSLPQAVLAIGGLRAPYGDPDEPAETIAHSMMAGGMLRELRTLQRTSYGVVPTTWDTKLGPMHRLEATIEPADAKQAIERVLLSLQRFLNDPAAIERRLEDVRRDLAMGMMNDHHGSEAAHGQLMRAAAEGLPPHAAERRLRRLKALDVDDVVAAAQRLYASRSLRIGLVGDPAALAAARAALPESGTIERRPADLVGLDDAQAPAEPIE